MNNTIDKNTSYLTFSSTVVVAIGSSILLSLLFGETQTGSVAFWAMQALYTLFIGSVPIFVCAYKKIDFVSATGLQKKLDIGQLVIGAFVVFFLINFMTPVTMAINKFIVEMGFNEPSVNLPNTTTDQLFPYIVVACVLPAFCEELVFRGVVANGLTERGKTNAVIISGALFSIFHMNPAQTLHQFVLGCFFAVVMFNSGNLVSSVVLHFFNNLCAVVLSYTLDKSGFYTKYPWQIAIVSAVLLAISIGAYVLYCKKCNKSCKKINNDDYNAMLTEDCKAKEIENKNAKNKAVGADYGVVFWFIGAVALCIVFWVVNLLQ